MLRYLAIVKLHKNSEPQKVTFAAADAGAACTELVKLCDVKTDDFIVSYQILQLITMEDGKPGYKMVAEKLEPSGARLRRPPAEVRDMAHVPVTALTVVTPPVVPTTPQELTEALYALYTEVPA